MECKITSFKQSRRASAFTLVEIMVASAIGSLVLLATTSLTVYTARSFASVANYVDMDQHNRQALDRLAFEIRQADGVADTCATNKLVLMNGGVVDSTYDYDGTARTLTRTKGGASEVLLTGCNQLTFSYFSRNTVANTFDQFPPTNNMAVVKLVMVDWQCSRKLYGVNANTDTAHSAKIVIRHK